MASISFEEALRTALDGEQASSRFYSLLAESTQDQQARDFLEKMAHDETRHYRQIEQLGKKMTEKPLPPISAEGVQSTEASPLWADVDDIGYEQALAVALEAEEHAELLYDAIADALEEGPDRTFFELLAETERQHAENLRRLIKP